jgi:hypothetical protein
MHADCHADILDTSKMLLHGDPLTLESMRTVDLDTGETVWRPDPPLRVRIFKQTFVCELFFTTAGMRAVDLDTGETMWRPDPPLRVSHFLCLLN